MVEFDDIWYRDISLVRAAARGSRQKLLKFWPRLNEGMYVDIQMSKVDMSERDSTP